MCRHADGWDAAAESIATTQLQALSDDTAAVCMYIQLDDGLIFFLKISIDSNFLLPKNESII